MKIRQVTVFAAIAAATLLPTAAFAATATTLPSKAPAAAALPAKAPAAAPAATKAAPVAAAPVVAATTKAAVPAKIVVAGNFCKKVLVGQSSHDTAGAVLNCVADAKGQPRWTK